ncbi:MAG: hypothetical protein Q4G04_04905 [bacterium]|nr:hypothetical protein [bacterium]
MVNEYIQEYGNHNIICWYEGLKSTKEFLDDFIKGSEVNNSNEL